MLGLIIKALVIGLGIFFVTRFVKDMLLPESEKRQQIPKKKPRQDQDVIEICSECGEDLTGRLSCPAGKKNCPYFKS